jgi:hypothetical protein
MWHIPTDLLPGSELQESAYVDRHPGRLAGRHPARYPLLSSLHSQGERLTWKKHLLRTAVALAVGLLITWIVWL